MAKISKAGRPKGGIVWTKENISLLKKLYPKTPNSEAAEQMGITVSALRNAAMKHKVKKADNYWDKPETDYLLKNWEALSAEELAIKLKRTRWAIINKYRELTGKR